MTANKPLPPDPNVYDFIEAMDPMESEIELITLMLNKAKGFPVWLH